MVVDLDPVCQNPEIWADENFYKVESKASGAKKNCAERDSRAGFGVRQTCAHSKWVFNLVHMKRSLDPESIA